MKSRKNNKNKSKLLTIHSKKKLVRDLLQGLTFQRRNNQVVSKSLSSQISKFLILLLSEKESNGDKHLKKLMLQIHIIFLLHKA